jgi:hypothetical protein
MASTSETGHTKNASTFEDLISFCIAYGAAYNPSKAALKIPALNAQLAAAHAALQAVKTTKTAYDNATNAREIAFKPLKSLATKIIGALVATDATSQTIDDARTMITKIRGQRAKAVVAPEKKEGESEAEVTKTNSTSQQSFDKMIDHYAQLLEILSTEATYLPNENELKVSSLTAMINDLRAKNTAVINAYAAVSTARLHRDTHFYREPGGMISIALDVKQYVKSIFGTKATQYKQISGLKFTKGKGE